MISAKKVILTAIKFKGIQTVKKQSSANLDDCLCSEGYIKNIIRKVEKGELVIL
jgi:hypothetical protein